MFFSDAEACVPPIRLEGRRPLRPNKNINLRSSKIKLIQMEAITFTTTLKALAHGGAAVGEVNSCESNTELVGKTAFIPYTIPGEVVEASIDSDHKNYIEGNLLKIISPSSSRIEPACPYFGQCGGCNLQHMDLLSQRKFKLEMVQGYLDRHSGISDNSKASLYGSELEGFAYR